MHLHPDPDYHPVLADRIPAAEGLSMEPMLLLTGLLLIPSLAAETLTVQDAVQEALKSSERIKIGEAALRKAGRGLGEAIAELLPRAGLEASAYYLSNPPEPMLIEAGSLGTITAGEKLDLTPLIPSMVPFSTETPPIPEEDI